MNHDRVRRAQLVIASLSIAIGIFAFLNAGSTFSGPGEKGLLAGDDFFVGSLFKLNATGGLVFLVAGGLGVRASQRGPALLAYLGAMIACAAGLVVIVGNGDSTAIVGAGTPSNAALLVTVALGLAVTAWATTATTVSEPSEQ